MSTLLEYIDLFLGLSLEGSDLGALQMPLRAFIVFVFAITLVRLGDGRFMGRHAALDVILGVIFGSVASRTINGSAAFLPTLAASAVLVALHWAFAAIAFRSPKFGWLFKGPPHRLVTQGKIDWEQMRRTHSTKNDLAEAIRQCGHSDDIGNIEAPFSNGTGHQCDHQRS